MTDAQRPMMRRESRLLHRLRYETMDWCRSVQGDDSNQLSLHRDSVQHRPEVWDNG